MYQRCLPSRIASVMSGARNASGKS
jgi:hypothetical protein